MRASISAIRTLLIVTSLVSCFATNVLASGQNKVVYVDRQLGDCVNTFIVRVLVAASNEGSAMGEFDGSQYLMTRYTRGDVCQVEMLQVASDGRTLEERSMLQCLFSNPLAK